MEHKKTYENYHEKKAHTSVEFPYNTYLCTIPLDFLEVPFHWHEEAELIAIKKGKGVVLVDLSPYEVEAGDIVFVLPGQLHAIRQRGDCVMEYENILFRAELLEGSGVDLCSTHFLHPLFSGLVNFSPYIGAGCTYFETISACIAQIDSVCSRRPFGYQMAVKGFLFQLLFELVTNHTMAQETGSLIGHRKALEKVKLVLAYVQRNYGRAITIEEIAGVCHYSKSHFMKFFKEAMGMGFVQYLNDYRLGIASQRLLSGQEGILEVAASCGFENLSYFNRLFKRKYGISPSQFRNQYVSREENSL